MTRRHRFLSMASTSACATFFCAALLPGSASGQAAPLPPPVYNTVDQNGVELATGRIVVPLASASIGSGGPGSLSYQFSTDPFSTQANIGGYVTGVFSTGNSISVLVGGKTVSFKQSGALGSAAYTQEQGNSSKLSYAAGSSTFTFTSSSGEVSVFAKGFETSSNSPYWLQSRTMPNGVVLRYYYLDSLETLSGQSYHMTRLRNVTSSLGYQIRITYTLVSGTAFATQAIAFNMANESCAPTATSCTFTNSWPTASYDTTNGYYTDQTGVKIRVTGNGSSNVTLTYPSGNIKSYSGAYVTRNNRNYFVVSSYGDGKAGWRYQNPSPYSATTLVFEPGSTAPKQYIFTSFGAPSTISDSSNGASSPASTWTYNSLNQVSAYTLSNGISGSTRRVTNYAYDGRGNLTQETVTASDGSGSTISRSAHFPATCDNIKICNQPDYTIDAKGYRTDYSYEPNSGQIAVVTLPAPVANAVRPETRYTYTPQSAQFFNGSGAKVSGDAVYLATQIAQCRTTTGCSGTADEVKNLITYDSASALNAISITTGSGGGANPVTNTVTRSFDSVGNLRAIDGPLQGSADLTRSYYDSGRRKIGEIGPDPDGSGALKFRAVRITYAPDGQVAQQEVGTATGQGDGDMATFAPLQSTSNSYDAQGRISTTRTSAAGVIYGVVQNSYDSFGILQCQATRMNPAIFASLPGSACSAGDPGPNGPDRIVQFTHDNLFRLTSETAAVGTANPETVIQRSYGLLGEVASETDGNGNQTVYGSDGFGRRITTTYPGGSYEQLGYDANGNVKLRRLRDGQTLTYDFDALNRRVFDHNPKTNVAEVDVGYSYDLLGRLTSAGDGNGWTKNFVYDALGRATTQSSNVASTALQYDAAGRKTRQTWADGFYVTYEYNAAGQMTVIRENGGLALATFAYDDLGRRTSLTRGNGTVTSYGYDGASRLTSLTQDLAGTAWDQTYGFTYNAAGQILTRSSSNDSYAWTGAANVDRSYAVNALNQYTSAGGTTFGYDARGNLTNSGGTTYQYNSRNQLFMNAAGQLIYRNPVGELGQTPAGNFDWVDGQLAQESSSAVLRRYVYGPEADEVLVWYEGSGTGDRRYLHADERGSVVTVSNDAGNAIAINSYDEYGIPGANNQGRFQYTGQAWLPELGMYDYKARMYSPTLGRFMQTDPIGYADGMNWYNYVGADPINGVDPTGLQDCRGTNCPVDPPLESDIQVTGTLYQVQDACFGYACNAFGSTSVSLPTDIVVTGYDRNDPRYHRYEFTNLICSSMQYGCTFDRVFEGLLLNAAPGQNGPAFTGNIVSVPLAGRIQQQVNAKAGSVTNFTLKGHMFDPGYVTRTVVSFGNSLYINTVGEGIGRNKTFNMASAQPAFTFLDARISLYAVGSF